MQAYTFHNFNFYETVARTKSVGVESIEAFYGQTVSDDINVPFGDMNPAQRQVVKRMLAEQGVRIVNYYASESVPNDEAQYRKLFDFARDMGVETIVTEPPVGAIALIDRLCQEYRISLAIHNHPKGQSCYWDPDTVLAACESRSGWIGACGDTGHWVRSGIDPVAAIRKLGAAGRIKAIHFKDLDRFGDPGAHDVVWGTGVGRAGDVLAELASQGYDGFFSIEYEHNWENNLPDIRECVAFFRQTAAGLGGVLSPR
jgi:sugar phosphate isomerase/epimerase